MSDYFIRLAGAEDFQQIYDIWMQNHVIQYMSFEKMPADEFRAIFDQFLEVGEIYVMIHQQGTGESIIAVRRVEYGKGQRSHVVGTYSLGVDRHYLQRGCATRFYEELLEIFRANPRIKRIEVTQSGGNVNAFKLVEKYGFRVEAVFPEWLYRTKVGKLGRYNLLERYVYLLLDPTVLQHIVCQGFQFQPVLPQLRAPDENYRLEKVADAFYCYDAHDSLVAVCRLQRGQSVIRHIAFIDLFIENEAKGSLILAWMREISIVMSRDGIKKIECFTYSKTVINILRELGYHYRGEKIASIVIGDKYSNEAGVDFSFFDIEDAQGLLKTLDLPLSDCRQIEGLLVQCEKSISADVEQAHIDRYFQCYAHNLAYQMLREYLGEYHLYPSNAKPWATLIQQLPPRLKKSFHLYYEVLHGLRFSS